ncbi:MAG: response regulator [Sideroxydans sp.]
MKLKHNQQARKTFCTTREAAKALSVSLRTAQLWVDSGLLYAWKTKGGHRRIDRGSVDQLLAKSLVADSSVVPQIHRIKDSHRADVQIEPLDILVVEDDSALCRLYEIKFSEWQPPINVATATDGYEALIRIGSIKPDMLVADLNLPGMDGFRMLYTIRRMPELAEISIVVVSGLDAEEIARRGGIPWGIPLFHKPVQFDQLRMIADGLVENRRKLRSREVV